MQILLYVKVKLTIKHKYIKESNLSNIFVQQVNTIVELILLSTFPKQRKSTNIHIKTVIITTGAAAHSLRTVHYYSG